VKNSKSVKFIVLAILIFGVWSYLKKDQLPLEVTLESEQPNSPSEQSNDQKIDLSKSSDSESHSSNANNFFVAQNKEEESLGLMTQILKDSLPLEKESQDLVRELDNNQLSPELARDSNPYTGDMMIVRTKRNLPGTRYFHAQYFVGEDGKEFLQHMSFEFKGGAGAFDRAISAAQTLAQLGAPVKKTKDFIQWNISENREVWIKIMGEKDLIDDPYNAYTKADVGTIRVAVEKKIHDDQHQDHVENE